MIQNAYEKKDLAKAMGVFGSITGAGWAFWPVVGGTLVAVFSCPTVFLSTSLLRSLAFRFV